MGLTRIFVRRVTLTFVLVTLTILAGIAALRSLVVQEQPNTGLPAVSINVSYSGASTTELRDTIVRPIENALSGTQNLDHIDSTVQTGSAQITASFALGSSQSENLTNVQKALQQAQGQLPSDLIAPTIRTADPSQPVVVTIALTSKKYSAAALGNLAQNQIVPVLEQVPGVSNVNVKGQTQPAYEVLVDPALLAASNLTLTDVIDAIAPNNIRAPGGIVYQPSHETQVDIRGDITTPQSVANLPIHVAYTGTSSAATFTGGGATGAAAADSGATTGASGPPGNGGSDAAIPHATIPPLRPNASSETSAADSETGIVPARRATGGFASSALSAGHVSTTSGFSASSAQTTTTSSGTAATAASGPTSTVGAGATAAAVTAGSYAGAQATAIAPSSNVASNVASVTAAGTPGSTSYQSAVVAPLANGSIGSSLPSADQQVNANAVSTGSASIGTAPPAALATGASSAFGGAAGTSFSPFVGALGTWAVPGTDKRVSDVASVKAGSAPLRVFAHENGGIGIGLDIQKSTTASEVTVAQTVLASLPKLQAQFPDVDFKVEHVQATYTREQLQGVEHTLLEGIVLTAVVMLFFLKSWRNAVVVMIAIPTSLGVTLAAMRILGLTLDTISLLGMTLVIGILIDDSTVVLENAMRHKELGEAAPDAAVNGRSEIGMAAIVITLVDVVVFLPIAFIGGAVGTQLSEFGIVVSIATLTSLLVSFTVTPALAGLWSMRSTWKPWPIVELFDGGFETLRRSYSERWLTTAMRYPFVVIGISVILCGAAIALVPLGIVGEEYIPQGDQGEIFVQVQFPSGTSLSKTATTMFALEKRVKPIVGSDLDAYETTAGSYDAPFGGPAQEGNVGQIHIWLATNHKISSDAYVAKLEPIARRYARGAIVVVKPVSAQGGGPRQPIDVLVQTSDGADPTPYARKIAGALRGTPGTTAVTDSGANVAPQVEVIFDRVAAQVLDVSIGTASTAIRAAMGGSQATQIETTANGLTQIEVIYPRSEQTSLDDILSLPVRTQNGGIVRISDFAQLKSSPASLLITRENRNDVIHVSANVAPGYELSNVVNDFTKRVQTLGIPKTVAFHAAAQGQQDLMRQTLQTLSGSLVASLVLVFLMIVALYNSFRTPLVTLFAIPLATIGALAALALTHNTLNLYSLIGTVLLVGLVTKNGILLVDYADIERKRGKYKDDAMRSAAGTRFRPIVMTTIAMVAGMTPLALGLDPGASQRASLGIAVIGGLLSSLILTLVIVPIMYHWLAPNSILHETELAAPSTA